MTRIKLESENARVYSSVEIFTNIDGGITITIDNGTNRFQQLKLNADHKWMLIDALAFLHSGRRA